MAVANEQGFFDFVIDAQKDEKLSNQFKQTQSLDDLKEFFIKKHPEYRLSTKEIEKIWKAVLAMRQSLCEESSFKEVCEVLCGGRGY